LATVTSQAMKYDVLPTHHIKV